MPFKVNKMAKNNLSRGLLFFNILYAVAALATLGVAIFFQLELQDILNVRNEHHYKLVFYVMPVEVAPGLFLGLGSLFLVIAIYGYWISVKKNHALSVIYISLVGFAVICHVAIIIFVFQFVDTASTEKYIEGVLFDGFSSRDYYHRSGEMFNKMQRKYECCGVTSPSEYGAIFPPSCCDDNPAVCEGVIPNQRLGCLKVVMGVASHAFKWFAGASLIIIIFEIINIALAVYRYRKMDHSRIENKYNAENEKITI